MHTRLKGFLLERSMPAGTDGRAGGGSEFRVRRPDLAERLEMTLEELDGELAELASRGVVELGSEGTIRILDRAALADRRPSFVSLAVPVSDRERVDAALRAILADEHFAANPRTSALLIDIVERAMAGDVGPMDPARVFRDVLGHTSGFDPRDPALRVLIGRLRKMLLDYDARTPDKAVTILLEAGGLQANIELLESEDADAPDGVPSRS